MAFPWVPNPETLPEAVWINPPPASRVPWPGSILRLMMRDSMAVVAMGVALGWAGAFALSRTLESQLFGTSATDVTTYGAVALVLGMAALGASFVPARRSTGIDPILAIRDE